MTDQTRLAEIRARVEAATPGPWEFSESNLIVAPEPDDSDWWGEVASVTDSYFNNTVDADFIAHSRADVPFLLNLVASLTAERDALRDRYEPLRSWADGAEIDIRDLADQRDDLRAQLAQREGEIEALRRKVEGLRQLYRDTGSHAVALCDHNGDVLTRFCETCRDLSTRWIDLRSDAAALSYTPESPALADREA